MTSLTHAIIDRESVIPPWLSLEGQLRHLSVVTTRTVSVRILHSKTPQQSNWIVLQQGCHGSLVSPPCRGSWTKVPRNHYPETPSGRTQIPMTSTHNETCGTRQLDHKSAQRVPERWTTYLRNNQYSIYINTLWPRIQYRKWWELTTRPAWNMMMGTAWGWETVVTVIFSEIQDKINKDLTLALL